jgi:hypothetical protein
MEALSSVAVHGQKESHITAVTNYYCILLVHINTFVIAFDNIRELNKCSTNIQSCWSLRVPLSQAAGIKVAGSAKLKLAILRETTAGECHSAGRSSTSLNGACHTSL